MADAGDVHRIALALPGVTQRDREPGSFRVDDKMFAWTWLERVDPRKARVPQPGVLVVRVQNELEKQALLSVDAEKFFTEPHYHGYPAVLVRLANVDTDELTDLLTAAWRTKAPRKLLAELDG